MTSVEEGVKKETEENLNGGLPSVNLKDASLSENLKDAGAENVQEVLLSKKLEGQTVSVSDKREPDGTSEQQCDSHLNNVADKTDLKDKEKEFALEGELLDFEDFNTLNSGSGEKNVIIAHKKDGAADKKAENTEKEDGVCSEGELNDNDDLEEGELREPQGGPAFSDTQGQPTRQVCRFYHKGLCFYGNACRFLHQNNREKGNYSMFDTTRNTTSGFPSQAQTPNFGGQRQPPRVPEFISSAPVPFCTEESPWEKGLREARNLLKQANQKRNDPHFAHKKLNISLCINERNIPPDDRIEKREIEREEKHFSRESYKGYDAYGDSHMYNDRREKDSRDNPPRHSRKESVERRCSKGRKDIGPIFVESYFDPWRRSKSPNRLSRERSHSSFSSYSSPPYSRSTSGSRSPASSRSSRSSRSPSVLQKRKVSPVPETAVSPKVSSNRFGPVKKKPGPRTSSSRSRSRSRNSSRSISMDSVSSASESRNSSPSHSSSDSEHEIKDLREKPNVTNPDSAPLDNKFKGVGSLLNSKRDLLEEKFEDAPVEMDLRYLIPKIPEKKEPVRLALSHKNPIKLTLLNKFPQSKAGFSKDSKEFPVKKPDESLKLNLFQGVKRPLSPSESAETVTLKQTPVLLPKKSASSRRDELLKQLKAVEDAIARKRAKF